MRASLSSQDVRSQDLRSKERRESLVADALRVAAERRDDLQALKARGLAAAGAEALCNGALRHAIRLSVETSRSDRAARAKPLSRRQMDKVIRIIARRRFAR